MVQASERFFTGVLDNGLSIVVEQMDGVRSVGAGFLCRTGARDEDRSLAGVSHFLEHMCFKGTPRRTAAEINIDFDRIGGQPNAFTSHERTFYHAVARTDDFGRQIEILADLMESTLPPDEFDMEKNVVLEEIAMSNDRIDHVAFDLLIEKVFDGHALGWPVLGYESTVGALTRDQMNAYFRQRYRPNNMTLVVAGNIDPAAVMASAESACAGWTSQPVAEKRVAPQIRTGNARRKMERFQQQVVAVTFPGPSAADPLHETAEAVAAILGGNNSRFYWNIEQTGLCPHAGAYRLDFGDCGLFILMAHCTPDKAEQVEEALRSEARLMMDGPINEAEFERVKNKRRTLIAVEGESPAYRLMQLMDDVDYRQRPRSVEDRLAEVDAISQASVNAYFERFSVDGPGFLVSVGPQ